jgi:cytochrome c oxidase assembly factor CtaG
MWPTFGVFGIVLWWHIVHDDPETIGARGLERLRREAETAKSGTAQSGTVENGTVEQEEEAVADDAITRAEAEDAELAAYNAYLAELREGPDTKTWRRR